MEDNIFVQKSLGIFKTAINKLTNFVRKKISNADTQQHLKYVENTNITFSELTSYNAVRVDSIPQHTNINTQQAANEMNNIIDEAINFAEKNDESNGNIDSTISRLKDQLIKIISKLSFEDQKIAMQTIAEHVNQKCSPKVSWTAYLNPLRIFQNTNANSSTLLPGALRCVLHTLQNINDNPNVLKKLNDINDQIQVLINNSQNNNDSESAGDTELHLKNLQDIFQDIFMPPYQPNDEGSCFASAILMKIWHDDLPSFIELLLESKQEKLPSSESEPDRRIVNAIRQTFEEKFGTLDIKMRESLEKFYNSLPQDKKLLYSMAVLGEGKNGPSNKLFTTVKPKLNPNILHIRPLESAIAGLTFIWNCGWMPVCAMQEICAQGIDVIDNIHHQLLCDAKNDEFKKDIELIIRAKNQITDDKTIRWALDSLYNIYYKRTKTNGQKITNEDREKIFNEVLKYLTENSQPNVQTLTDIIYKQLGDWSEGIFDTLKHAAEIIAKAPHSFGGYEAQIIQNITNKRKATVKTIPLRNNLNNIFPETTIQKLANILEYGSPDDKSKKLKPGQFIVSDYEYATAGHAFNFLSGHYDIQNMKVKVNTLFVVLYENFTQFR